jgi:sugar phosphate isomerase/epimerase
LSTTRIFSNFGSKPLSRRAFLRHSVLLSAACTPLGNSLAQGRQITRPGLQLYTLRNELAQDFEGTLARVAALGYKEMEFAGYFDRTPAEIRAILDRNGLTSPAAHIQLAAVRNDLDAMIESALTIGQRYIVIPFLQPNERTLGDFERLIETLNHAGEAARSAGLKMAYHNHDFEFTPIDGHIPYELLLEQTDPELVDFELDLYWIRYAGVDQTRYFDKYPGRFSMLHVKDMSANRDMADVGRGLIDFAEIFSHQDRAGFQHFFVEHDRPGDGLASVAVSVQTLRQLTY